jgi:hypothetical protein
MDNSSPGSLVVPSDPVAMLNGGGAGRNVESNIAINTKWYDLKCPDSPNNCLVWTQTVNGRIIGYTHLGRSDLASVLNPSLGGSYGWRYGAGCEGGIASHVYGRYGRHLVTSTGDAHEVPPHDILLANAWAYEYSSSAFDAHWSAYDIVYAHCAAIQGTGIDDDADGTPPPTDAGSAGFHPRAFKMRIFNPVCVGHPVGFSFQGSERVIVQGGYTDKCRVGAYFESANDIHFLEHEFIDPRDHAMYATGKAGSGGITGVAKLKLRNVTTYGNPSGAAYEWRDTWQNDWDFKNVTAPDATVKSNGYRTHYRASAASVDVPINANYWELRGGITVSELTGLSELDIGRQISVLVKNGLVLSAPNAVLNATNVPAMSLFQGMYTGQSLVLGTPITLPFEGPNEVLTATAVATRYRGVGLRKLHPGYAGSAIRVRRSSDNVEANIGFDAKGRLDEAALLTHVGANHGYVVTWFDQFGSTRDYTQATTTAQGQIVNAGAIIKINGYPVVLFDGVDDCYISTAAGLYAAGQATVGMVLCASPQSAAATVWSENSSTATNPLYELLQPQAGSVQPGSGIRADDGTQLLAFAGAGGGALLWDNTLRQFTVFDTGSSIGYRVDASYDEGARPYTRSTALTANRTSLGARSRPTTPSQYYSGYICEVVSYTSNLSDRDKTLLAANQRFAYDTV